MKYILKYDITQGIFAKWFLYIPVIIVTLMSVITTHNDFMIYNTFNAEKMPPSLFDYLIVLNKGELPYFANNNESFELPAIWMFNNIYILFISSNYPIKQIKGIGRTVLMKTKSRFIWWKSKYLYTILSVMTAYIVQYVTILVYFEFNNSEKLYEPTIITLNQIYDIPKIDYVLKDLILYLIIIPTIVITTVALIQLIIMLVTPKYNYFIVILYFGISAYYFSPYLLGNATMFLRSNLVLKQGTDGIYIIICCLIINIMVYILGHTLFKNKNIL